MKRRKLFVWAGAAAAVFVLVMLIRVLSPTVEATDINYPIRILEITDPTSSSLGSDGSELDGLRGVSNITIDTVTMKKFVSLRENWDGKYDAIYIGQGAFSKQLVNSASSMSSDQRAQAHATTSVQNDITLLKAKEITDYYINKGLYVFFRDETFAAQTTSAQQGNLYHSFNVYRTAAGAKSNVVFLRNQTELDTLIAKIKDRSSPYLTGLTRRPELKITNKSSIISYLSQPAHSYSSGDTLSFSIKLDNTEHLDQYPVRVRLYINVDSSLPMTEDNLVASVDMKSSTGTLNYTLPETYSGPLYWKLEVTDTFTGLKNFDSDVILYHGIKPVIRVLQVTPYGKADSSLLKSNNMNPSYLSGTDYELKITVMDMLAFNTYIANHAKNPDGSPSTDATAGLNGVYDMIVFGFQDMYDRVTTPMLSEQAAQAVKAFTVQTKQSLMLTHDTIYRDPVAYVESTSNGTRNINYWSLYFHDLVGQALPRTYLGGQAVNPATKVVPVNNGLLTQYPFNLSSTGDASSRYSVATTHDQFFPLDLERADVIPWYNIQSKSGDTYKRDTDDSYNHFYTYSVGTITFSGTGHSNSNFPDWEQKLFVNTMYRAFTGANHAPEITVNAPAEASVVPSYVGDLLVDFSVRDFDLNDKDLTASIRFKSGGQYLSNIGIDNVPVKSGQSISRSFANPLPQGGDLEIEIKAADSHGALSTKTIHLTIRQAKASLEASRSLPSSIQDGVVNRGDHVDILYSVIPKPIAFADSGIVGEAGSQQLISNIVFTENLPANLEIAGSSTDIVKTGNAASGYKVTKKLNDIRYTLQTVNGVKTFVPDPNQQVTFSITVVPAIAGDYSFGTALLNYDEIHSASPPALLSSAADYNLFVTNGDLDINRLEVQGKIAASGDVDLQNVHNSVNSLDEGGPYTDNAIVAGGDFRSHQSVSVNGTAVYGNVVYGGTAYIENNADFIKGKVLKGTPVDFASAREKLNAVSAELGAMAQNGTVNYDNRVFTLTGSSGAKLYVFNLSEGDVSEAKSMAVSVPSGSTVLINIRGNGTAAMELDTTLSGVDAGHVIYNFVTAASLSLKEETTGNGNKDGINGTILAPKARLSFNSGTVTGQIIAGSVDQLADLNFSPFTGNIPLAADTPAPGSVQFSPLQLLLHAVVKIESIDLQDTTILLNDEPLRLLPAITPSDATNQTLAWRSSDPSIVSVDETGSVVGHALGSALITASATDGSGKSDTAKITVVGRSLRIEGEDHAKPNTNVNLTAVYETINETNITYTWKVTDKNGSELSGLLNQSSGESVVFNTPSSGQYTVTVTVKSNKTDGVTSNLVITVANPIERLTISGGDSVVVNGSLELSVTVAPADADPAELVWSLNGNTDSKYAELVPVQGTDRRYTLQAKDYPTKDLSVVVTAPSLGIRSDAHKVEITGLTGLEFSSTSYTLYVGDQFNLNTLLWTIPRSVGLEAISDNLAWTSGTPAIASFATPVTADNRGWITASKKGSTDVTVTYSAPGQSPVTAHIEIIVLARTQAGTDGDRY